MLSKVYQIFYSENTKKENDSGFLQLDNLANERPDWREYWPIRNFLLKTHLDANAYYGFFSPKFKLKTNLDSSDVFNFVEKSEADVFLFSPFFDQSAFPVNIFEQASAQHKGIFPILEECFRILDPNVNISNTIMNSTNTVFCNFFIAKASFWNVWLKYCESIYAIAEENATELAMNLNRSTNHDGGTAPTKVFVIERIASFLLCTSNTWKVKAFNPMALPYALSPIAKFRFELCLLDSLKIAYSQNKFRGYIEMFNKIRSDIVMKLGREVTGGREII